MLIVLSTKLSTKKEGLCSFYAYKDFCEERKINYYRGRLVRDFYPLLKTSVLSFLNKERKIGSTSLRPSQKVVPSKESLELRSTYFCFSFSLWNKLQVHKNKFALFDKNNSIHIPQNSPQTILKNKTPWFTRGFCYFSGERGIWTLYI